MSQGSIQARVTRHIGVVHPYFEVGTDHKVSHYRVRHPMRDIGYTVGGGVGMNLGPTSKISISVLRCLTLYRTTQDLVGLRIRLKF